MKMNPLRLKDNNGGFTLLEVMISLTILAVGILGVIGMFTTSIGGNAQGKHQTEATNYAQSKLDELANATIFDDLTSCTTPDTDGIYTISWKVTDAIPSIGRKLREIKVTATWTTKGETHKVELSTMRSKS